MTQHIYLGDHIFQRHEKSSAVTNITFQMAAQWVLKATKMLPSVLSGTDTLLRVAAARLLQNTNERFLWEDLQLALESAA